MDPLEVSALSSLIQFTTKSSTHLSHHHALATQVLHNLQRQHGWTSLQVHTHLVHSADVLPRPLVTGLPPHRIYVHPDEQIEMLKQGIKEQDMSLEREWVLPTHLREEWSLRKFAEVFDAITEVPPEEARTKSPEEANEHRPGGKNMPATRGARESKRRRGGKRLLLATVGDDSTIVYYIVHDGIVKPRQN